MSLLFIGGRRDAKSKKAKGLPQITPVLTPLKIVHHFTLFTIKKTMLQT